MLENGMRFIPSDRILFLGDGKVSFAHARERDKTNRDKKFHR